MPATNLSADEDQGRLTASTNSFSLKSEVGEDGREREYVEGFLATTHIDKGNDEFTEQALRNMAADINGEDVDAVFNDVDTEALREATVGNLDHNNNPASPFGDTRTVPAFKVQEADVRETGDGEKGLRIKALLNTGGMLDETVSAVKNSIKEDFLNAFSIEFVPQQVKKESRGERVVRVIKDAAAKGAALTGRPMNPAATMTDAMLKSMAAEYKVEYAYEEGATVYWDTSQGQTSGQVEERTKDSCFNDEIDGDFEVCGEEDDPAYLIEVDNEEGTMVAHKQSELRGSKTLKAELSEEERTPPQAAQDNAQAYLDAKEEGLVPESCGTGAGTDTAEALAEGEPLSPDKISDVASYARHSDNKEPDVGEDESEWMDCGYAQWQAWGGDEGIEWAQSLVDDMKAELKQDYTVQTPEYDSVAETQWSAPDREDFPDDYDVLTIFLARNRDSDNFSDQALPVVDYRDGEAVLVLEALRSAYNLAPQVDGLNEDEVESARAEAERLAENEFDVMLDEDEKNDMPMAEDEPEESPEGDEPEGEEEAKSEVKALTEDIKELKSQFEDLKSVNEELKEENEDLKAELQDLKTLESVKEDIDEVKSMVDDVELETGPRAEKNQSRASTSDEKPRWQKTIDGMRKPENFFDSEGKSKSMLESFVEGKNVSKEEVKDYVYN